MDGTALRAGGALRTDSTRPFQCGPLTVEKLDPEALQTVCAALSAEERACARLACRALRDGCRQADVAAGGAPGALRFAPFFRTASLAAWCEASQPGGQFSGTIRQTAAVLAAAIGSLSAARWALSTGSPWEAQVVSQPAGYGKELNDAVGEVGLCTVTMAAARHGHLAVVEWAHANGCPAYGGLAYRMAAKGGHLEVVKWAVANDSVLDEHACHHAAAGGHLEVLQWAVANGCPWQPQWVCDSAASAGRLAVLQWLRDIGCPLRAQTCCSAAQGGHLGVLQWLRASGWPWDEEVCNLAAIHGHLEVLKWARANGCPWDRLRCRSQAGRRLDQGRAPGAQAEAIVAWIDSQP